MMAKPRDITGQRFGRLVALAMTDDRVRRQVVWRYRCECGNEKLAASGEVSAGKIESCGCLGLDTRAENGRRNITRRNVLSTRHGMTNTPTWRSWKSMIDRCELPTHKSFAVYGGRGIAVCERWHIFENFLADMDVRPINTTLDRFPNVNGNYESGNCRWATGEQQGNNRRNNRLISYDGRTQTLGLWARELGMDHQAIAYRLNQGWSIKEAFETPLDHGNGWKRGVR